MKRLNGFSLMEMMVVLSIVAIVAAASAPMVNKKMVRETTDTSLWKRTVGSSIGYNMSNNSDNDNTTVGIGTSVSRPDNTNPKLYISSRTDTTPHIMFGHNGGHLYRFTAGGERNNIWLSDNVLPNNVSLQRSVVIGSGANASNNTQVVIGNNANSNYVNTVVIGNGTRAANSGSENAVVIGPGANSVVGTYGVALGSNASLNGNRSVAIGYSAASSGTRSIAIGGAGQRERTSAQGNDSLAMGTSARATAANSIAMGFAAMARDARSIAIGTSQNDTMSTGNGKTLADAVDSIAIGSLARTQLGSTNAIAIGRGALVNNESSSAVVIGSGSGVGASSNNATAMGPGTTVGANSVNAMAIGQGATVFQNNNNSVAIGPNVTVNNNSPNTMVIGQGMSASRSGTNNVNVTTVGSNTQKTIVLGDRNTRVYIPGTLVPTNLEISSLNVRGNVNVLGQLRVGNRAFTGFNMYGYCGRHPRGNWHGDTSLIVGMFSKDDHNNAWVHPGGNKGHANWQYAGLSRQEQGHEWKTVNADRYDDESQVWSDAGVRDATRNAFTDFYQVFGLRHPGFPSDRRLKNIGKTFNGGLAELKKLDLFNYTYKDDTTKTPHVGVIAQDLQKIFPDAVMKGEDGFLRIRMEDMFYALVNAVKELDTRLTTLEQKQKKIDELEKRVDKLEKRLEALEKIKN